MKNEKGRIAQSKAILKEVEKEEIYRLRESTKQMLHNLAGKNITNAHDGRIAQVSKKNIGKMVSDKAIAKSVANGFSAMEHFNAVNDIESLYKNAIFKETTADKHGEIYLKIHRYNAQFENANALITLKETTEHGNKIYTLELEELAPTKQVHSQAIGEQLSKSRKLEPMHPNTPLENSNTIIPQIQDNETIAKEILESHFSAQLHFLFGLFLAHSLALGSLAYILVRPSLFHLRLISQKIPQDSLYQYIFPERIPNSSYTPLALECKKFPPHLPLFLAFS